MAELYKSSAEAGAEVRRSGQTGIAPAPQSSSTTLAENKPRGGLAAPRASVDPEFDTYLAESRTPQRQERFSADPEFDDYLAGKTTLAPETSMPSQEPPKEVGFTDSVEKGFKGLKLTWDYLANKLETAVTGSGSSTAPILQKSVEEYKALASDPRIQELIQRGNDAPDYYEGAKAMLKYIASNPGVAVNFLGEQLPAMAAAVLPGGVVGLGARGLAARGGLSATQSAAVGTAAFGATTNSSAVILGSLGTNYVEGLDKFKGDTQAASDYAATKTLAEVPANAVAGLFMGINPVARFAPSAPISAAVGNAAIQANVQGLGGAVGAYQAAQSVGEEAGRGELLAEYLGEAAFAPVEVATSGGLRRPGAPGVQPEVTPAPAATPPQTPQASVTVEQAPAKFDNAQPIDTPATQPPTGLTDEEFFTMPKARETPAMLSALYANADEGTRAQLQSYANKTDMKLDLANSSQNQTLLTQGNALIQSNPVFVGQFQERLGQWYERTRPRDFVPDPIKTAPKETTPFVERKRMDDAMAQEQEALLNQQAEDLGVLPKEDTQIGVEPTQTEVDTPIPSEPSPLAQLSQAEAQVRQGLPVDTSVDTQPTTDGIQVEELPTAQIEAQEAAQVELTPEPQETPIVEPEPNPAAVDLDFTNQAGEPDFARFQQEVSAYDNAQYKIPSKPTDYIQVNVDPDIKTLADSLGIKVLGFRYVGNSQKLRMRYGMSNKEGAIALHDRAEEKSMFVFGHEVLHELASRNPADGRALVDEAIKYLSDEGKAAYKKKMKDLGYNPEQVNEEAVADMMGLLFRDQQFWNKVNEDNPTLIRKILNVIEDLIAKFGTNTARGKSIQKYITDYEAVRNLLADFLKKQASPDAELDFTQTTNQVQETQSVAPTREAPVETAVAQEPDRVPQNVPETESVQDQAPVQDVKDKRPIDVINADPNRVKKGTFKEQIKPVAPDIQEQERMAKQAKLNQAEQRKEFERSGFSDAKGQALANMAIDDAKSEYLRNDQAILLGDIKNSKGIVIGRLYDSTKNGIFMFRTAKTDQAIDGSDISKPSKITSVQQALKKGGEQLQFVSRRKVLTPTQGEIDFTPEKRKQLNKFKADAQRIMTTMFTPSTVQETLTELRGKLKDISKKRPFFKFNKKQSDVEYIFDQFAQVGAMESSAKRSNPVAAISKAIEAAQKADTNARAGLLNIHLEKISDALAGLRQEMQKAGFDDSTIDSVVGEQERSLDAIRESEVKGEYNYQKNPSKFLSALGEFSTAVEEDAAPEMDTLPFPDLERSDRIQAAVNALNEIEESKSMDVFFNEMRKPREEREFTYSDFRAAAKKKGIDISQLEIKVSQLPPFHTRLADFVFGNRLGLEGNYQARDQWVSAYNQIRNVLADRPDDLGAFERTITPSERRIIDYVNEQRSSLQGRINGVLQEKGEFFSDPKEAFPHALFNNFRLADLAPSKIPQNAREALRAVVGGNEDLLQSRWLADVYDAINARRDLQSQILSGMTEDEKVAVQRFFKKVDGNVAKNLAQSERGTFSSQVDALQYLPKKARDNFINAISTSEIKDLPKLLQRAREIDELKRVSENKKQFSDAMAALLGQVYNNDSMSSFPLDKVLDQVQVMEQEQLPQVSDAEIRAYQDKLAREGEEPVFDVDDIKQAIMFEKIAQSAMTDEFVTEQAADSSTQPENRGFLGGDISYKRGVNSHGPAATMVYAHLAEVTYDWPTQPAYEVYYNPGQIPDAKLRDRILSRSPTGDIKGAIDPDTGKVYIFSQRLADMADAEFVLFHELYGHWGLRYFLGDKIDVFLKNQYRLNQKVKAEADRQFDEAAQTNTPMSRIESIEEAISDMAANGDSKLFKEIIGRLITWLREHDMSLVADWLDSKGEAELAYVLSQARKAVRTEQGVSPMNGAPQEVLYARNKQPVELYSLRNEEVTGYARINPVLNSWIVYTKGEDGQWGYVMMEEYSDVYATLKKIGTVSRSRDRDTRQEIDPNKFLKIPDNNDVAGWNAFKRNLIMGAQNQYLPIMEIAEYMSKNGIKNTVIRDLKLYESRLKPMIDRLRVNYEQPMQKLLKDIGDKGGDMLMVDRFLAARHAKERNDYVNEITEGNNPIGSGYAPRAREVNGEMVPGYLDILDEAKSSPYYKELQQLGALTDKLSADHVNYMVETGLIDEKTAARLMRYQHYVNLSGNKKLGLDQYDESLLEGNGFNFKGREVRGATGRGTEAVDVLANTLNAYTATLIRGQKARVTLSILNMFEQAGADPTYVKIEPISEKKKLNLDRMITDNEILRAIGEQPTEASGKKYLKELKARVDGGATSDEAAQLELIARIDQAEQMRMIEPNVAKTARLRVNADTVQSGSLSPDGYVSMVEDNNLIGRKNVVVARYKGKPILMSFEDRATQFVQALSGASQQQRNDMIDLIGAWGRMFGQMLTSWNPAWVLPNGARDFQTAIANMSTDPNVGPALAQKIKDEWAPAYSLAFREHIIENADEVKGWTGKYMRNRKQKTSITPEQKELIEAFKNYGGETFFMDRKNLSDMLEELNVHMFGPQTTKQKFEARIDGAKKAMELLNIPMETAPRLATFKILRQEFLKRNLDKGMSQAEAFEEANIEAALYAKEVTVNFNMKGNNRFLRAAYVFFNPAVQGTVRMFKNYSRGEEGVAKFLPSNEFAKVAGAFFVIGFLGNFLARGLGGEAEDKPDTDKLDQIPEYKRATSLIIAPDVPGAAIPIAYGWNVFYTMGHYVADVMLGKLKVEEAANRVLKAAFEAFAPINSGGESKSLSGDIVNTIMPTILKPPISLMSNENMFGAPIYKQQSPFSDVQEADSWMHFESVNPISKVIMQGLNKVTGGTRYKSGLVDVNPGAVDYLISSYVPGLINELYKGAGLAIRALRGEDTKRAPLPIIDRLSARIPEQYDAGAMRRVSAQVSTLYAEYMSTQTSPERRAQIVKEHPGLGKVKALVAGVDQDIKKLNQQLKAVNESNASDEYKVKAQNRIKEEQKLLYKRAVKAAIQGGFRDAVVDNAVQGNTLNKIGGMVRDED
jgi:hypothetical protein